MPNLDLTTNRTQGPQASVSATRTLAQTSARVLEALQNPVYRPEEHALPDTLVEGMSADEKALFRLADKLLAGKRTGSKATVPRNALVFDGPAEFANAYQLLAQIKDADPAVAEHIFNNDISAVDRERFIKHETQVQAAAKEREEDRFLAEAPEKIRRLEETVGAQQVEINSLREALATSRSGSESAPAIESEKAEADAAKESGLLRGLVEIFEFMGRWLLPFTNLLSAGIRLARIAYKLSQGEDIDWSKEGLRLAGDMAGVLFPPMGAMANLGLNLYYNESQILGGVNEFFDDGKKDNYFRRQAGQLFEWAGDKVGGLLDDATSAAPVSTATSNKRQGTSVPKRPVALTI